MRRRDEDLAGRESLVKCSQTWLVSSPTSQSVIVCGSTEVVYTDERDNSFCLPCLSELHDDDELGYLLA